MAPSEPKERHCVRRDPKGRATPQPPLKKIKQKCGVSVVKTTRINRSELLKTFRYSGFFHRR
jgi:hypothetical protein